MSTRVEIEFISDGFRQILMSDGVRSAVDAAASDIQARANAGLHEDSVGFSKQVRIGDYGGGRWIGHVSTTDLATMVAEAEDKVLTRAVK